MTSSVFQSLSHLHRLRLSRSAQTFTEDSAEKKTVMEKVTDRAVMAESSHNEHKEISGNELGEYRCSDLDVPLCTSETFEPIFTSFLHKITNERWMILAAGHIDTTTTILLSKMCYQLVEEITVLVLQVVAPQVLDWVQGQISPDIASTSTNVSIKRNYYSVTEEDIQATLGDSLVLSFAEALGVEKEWPENDRLMELFAAEVKERVNCQLDRLREPAPSTETKEPLDEPPKCDSPTVEMVFLIATMLQSITGMPELPEDQGCVDSNCSCCCPEEVTEVQDFNEGDTIAELVSCSPETNVELTQSSDDQRPSSFPQDCCPVEFLEVQDFSYDDAIDEAVSFLSERQSADVPAHQSTKPSASSVEELAQQDKTFLAVFLGKLVEHIADSTKTSIFDVDFDGMLTRLRERTRGKLCSTLPQTVGRIHISVYRKLCLEFGSAKLLQAAMASGDGAFEDAVLKTLKMKLLKSTEETSSFVKKVKRFFGRRHVKVSPASEVQNASVSHHEVLDQDNGSTPPPPSDKQTRPAIVRMFSTVARFLRKPFASCISEASQG
ncbi:uncharacterized protein [Trachinotus anak]|uniref:uncharacterized protein n=1 Tax=Trachinotus anak TaxID=443729 RepID=UPI0039F19BB6